MSDGRLVVGYVLVRSGGKAKFSTAPEDRTASKKQKQTIAARCNRQHLHVDKFVYDVTSSQGGNFTLRPHFKKALEFARERSQIVMVYDLIDLLRRMEPDEMKAAIAQLRTLDVETVDALSGSRLKTLSNSTLWHLLDTAIIRSQMHGAAIKYGRRSQTSAPSAKASTAAAQSRSVRASQEAQLLAPRIRGFERDLAIGKALTPTLLARLLNEAKLPAPRGGEWQPSSAARLLERYRAFSVAASKAPSRSEP